MKVNILKTIQFFLLIHLLILTFNIPKTKCESQTFIFSDDFSADSGMWDFLGSAYRDSVNQYLVLTQPTDWTSGVVLFKVSFATPFMANFSYKAGGGSGADGFVVFFYKQKYYSFSWGSTLGFNDKYPNGTYKTIPGYGIEFDNWRNIEQPAMTEHADPSANHIALIKDHTGNHLIYVDDYRTEDYAWHNVSLTVEESSIRVSVDEDLIFQWNGVIDRTFNYFGFCAGTGAANNWHIIDNFSIKIFLSPLSVVISPLYASILVGQSVTFNSTVSGGLAPYTYQWYLNGNPVLGATQTSWTFTPTTSGIYYAQLKVTDHVGNMAESDSTRISVATIPVGGHSIPIQLPTTAKQVTLQITLSTILVAIFITIKRKTKV